MMTFVACNYGFFKITGHSSNIPCEMLAYFLYYRISCMLGIWIHLGVQEGGHYLRYTRYTCYMRYLRYPRYPRYVRRAGGWMAL